MNYEENTRCAACKQIGVRMFVGPSFYCKQCGRALTQRGELGNEIAETLKEAHIKYYIIPEDERHRWQYKIKTAYIHKRIYYGDMRAEDVLHEMLGIAKADNCYDFDYIEFCVENREEGPGFIVHFNVMTSL